MRSGYIIKNHLDKIGIEATLYDGEWNSMPFKCTVNPLWRKKSSAFDDDVTELMESISYRDFRKRNGKSLIPIGF